MKTVSDCWPYITFNNELEHHTTRYLANKPISKLMHIINVMI